MIGAETIYQYELLKRRAEKEGLSLSIAYYGHEFTYEMPTDYCFEMSKEGSGGIYQTNKISDVESFIEGYSTCKALEESND